MKPVPAALPAGAERGALDLPRAPGPPSAPGSSPRSSRGPDSASAVAPGSASWCVQARSGLLFLLVSAAS